MHDSTSHLSKQNPDVPRPRGPELLRLPEVKARTRLGRSTIYDMIQRRGFPAPIKLGERSVAWLGDEVEAWIAEKIGAPRPLDRK
jgi:prophage regulatory protein